MPRPKVRPRNRQRSWRACLVCKASKIRCDAGDPCGSCLRRDQGSSCIYSGVDRRRKGHGKSRDIAFVAKAPSLFAGDLPNSHASPNAPGIPTETSSPVERATPVLIPHAKSVDHTAMDQDSEPHTSDTGGKGVASSYISYHRFRHADYSLPVYIGQTSSLSFLYFLKRTIKGYIGSVPFTEEEGHHVTVDIPETAVEGITQILSFDEKCSLLDSYFEAVRDTPLPVSLVQTALTFLD